MTEEQRPSIPEIVGEDRWNIVRLHYGGERITIPKFGDLTVRNLKIYAKHLRNTHQNRGKMGYEESAGMLAEEFFLSSRQVKRILASCDKMYGEDVNAGDESGVGMSVSEAVSEREEVNSYVED